MKKYCDRGKSRSQLLETVASLRNEHADDESRGYADWMAEKVAVHINYP